MEADFGASATTAPELGTATTTKAAVSAGANIFDAGNTLLGSVSDALTAVKDKRQATALSQFTQQQLTVAEALDQGTGAVRSSAHAQTLMRRNLLNAIEANPALTKELVAAQSSLMGLAGGARVVADGTEAEQRDRKLKADLVSGGFVAPNATEAEFASAGQAQRIARASTERYNERMRTLDLELKVEGLGKTRREAVRSQKKQETERFVSENATAEFFVTRTRFEEILNGDGSGAEKAAAIKGYMTEWSARTSAAMGDIDSSMRSALMHPFERLEADYLEAATGGLELAELKRRNERNLATAEAIITQDPDIAKLVVGSKLFGGDAFTNMILNNPNGTANKKLMDVLASITGEGDIVPQYTSDKASVKNNRTALDAVLDGVGSPDSGVSEEARSAVNKVLEDLEDNQGKIIRDPKNAIGVIDWMASSKFLTAIRKDPDAFGNIDGVKSILDQHYHDEVSGLIRNQFKEHKVFVPAGSETSPKGPLGRAAVRTPSQELVQAVGVEGGMTFVAIDADNKEARAEAARLNKELKPIINQSVRAQAHLSGTDNYKKIWDEVSGTIFGGEGAADLAGGDAGDDLVSEDFVQPQAKITSLPKAVAEDVEFISSVEELASKYEVDPAVFLAVMDFETGGSFDPAQKNAAGSSGTGLIQFMAATAKGMGTSTATLSGMTRLEQMKWVEKYFDQHASKIRGGDASDVYMSVLYPKAAGKPDDYVLFRKGTKAYTQNAGLDKSGDGTVTKAEASAKVVALVDKYRKT